MRRVLQTLEVFNTECKMKAVAVFAFLELLMVKYTGSHLSP